MLLVLKLKPWYNNQNSLAGNNTGATIENKYMAMLNHCAINLIQKLVRLASKKRMVESNTVGLPQLVSNIEKYTADSTINAWKNMVAEEMGKACISSWVSLPFFESTGSNFS